MRCTILIVLFSSNCCSYSQSFSEIYSKANKLRFPYLSDLAEWAKWPNDSILQQYPTMDSKTLKNTFFSNKNIQKFKERKLIKDTNNMLVLLVKNELKNLIDITQNNVWCDSTSATFRFDPQDTCISILDHYSDFFLIQIKLLGVFPKNTQGNFEYVLGYQCLFYEGAMNETLLVEVNSMAEIVKIHLLGKASSYGPFLEYRRAMVHQNNIQTWERNWYDSIKGVKQCKIDKKNNSISCNWHSHTGLFVDSIRDQALYITNDEKGFHILYYDNQNKTKQPLIILSNNETHLQFRIQEDSAIYSVSYAPNKLLLTMPSGQMIQFERKSILYFNKIEDSYNSIFPDILYEDVEQSDIAH